MVYTKRNVCKYVFFSSYLHKTDHISLYLYTKLYSSLNRQMYGLVLLQREMSRIVMKFTYRIISEKKYENHFFSYSETALARSIVDQIQSN